MDLTPHKTCCYDCVFCQLGRTSEKTVRRKEYVPTAEVLSELDAWLETDGKADYITLSGSGDPTLHTGFGRIFESVHTRSRIPTVLLTNGSMLVHPEVRDAAALSDVVKVSLSAWDQKSFEWVNRPHSQLSFDRLVSGMQDFRIRFKGRLAMEVFLLKGINAMADQVRKIARIAKEIGPDQIQLNTAVRPPAEDFAVPLEKTLMDKMTGFFEPAAEVIAEFCSSGLEDMQANEQTIFSMLQRRPCTAEQIGRVFGMHLNEVSKYLGILYRERKIHTELRNKNMYYSAPRGIDIHPEAYGS